MQPVFFHYLVPEYFPKQGGLQTSLRRISHLNEKSFSGSKHNIYVLGSAFDNFANVYFVKHQMKRLAHSMKNTNEEGQKAYKQLMFLSLVSMIEPIIRRNSDYQHVFISFYTSHAGFYAQMLSAYFNLPHITSVRGSDFFANFVNHTSSNGMEFAIRQADHIVTTNDTQRRMLETLYAQEIKGKITTIHNSIEFTPPRWHNHLYHQPKRSVRLFTDGGFSCKKGTDMILDGLETIAKKQIPAQLVIAGEISGFEKQYWEERIDSLQSRYPNYLHPLGFIDNVHDELVKSDVYISMSLSEGCSNSRILALCTGIPIVSTSNGAIIDYAFDNSYNRFVTIGDTEGMLLAIKEIVEYMVKNANLNKNIEIEKRLRYFSLENEREAWKCVINSVLGQ